jgi:alkylhydroperoxidase family enzyme
MTRIPNDTTATTLPEQTVVMLKAAAPGREQPLNLHAQMAHAPALLAGYMGIRDAIAAHGTLDPKARTAIMLTVSTIEQCRYAQALNAVQAARAGWGEPEIAALRAREPLADARMDALIVLVAQATSNAGRVDDAVWQEALDAGWSSAELGEAFLSMSLAGLVDAFVRFAQTEPDAPTAPPERRAA